MALHQSISKTCPSTLSFEGCKVEGQPSTVSDTFYIKVDAITGTKDRLGCSVFFTGEKVKFKRLYEFQPSMNGENFIKQAYLYLKTLPEFAGAVDC